MLPCDKCLENRWSFKCVSGWMEATCKYCGAVVVFAATRKFNKNDHSKEINYHMNKNKVRRIVRKERKLISAEKTRKVLETFNVVKYKNSKYKTPTNSRRSPKVVKSFKEGYYKPII